MAPGTSILKGRHRAGWRAASGLWELVGAPSGAKRGPLLPSKAGLPCRSYRAGALGPPSITLKSRLWLFHLHLFSFQP